jgi:hypothetical protein
VESITGEKGNLIMEDNKTQKEKIIKKVEKGEGKFGAGTVLKTTEDGSTIERVDHAWQQKQGSKISSDGFHKEGHSNITMPKDIDTNTPEGDRKAGKFVEEVRTAVRRGKKLEYDTKQASKSTGIAHKPHTQEYKDGWNRIFGKRD